MHFHPSVEALRTTAGDVVAWINDLASMEKEEAAGADHNLVLVLRRTGGLSTPLARAVATDMVNDGIRRLWYDADALPDLGARPRPSTCTGSNTGCAPTSTGPPRAVAIDRVSEGEAAEPDR